MSDDIYIYGDGIYRARHNTELSRLLFKRDNGRFVHEIWQNSNGVEELTYRSNDHGK